nr:putative ribonuclease H-like domain-containing protein [Tanacetum cinerariifolium]
MLQGIPTASYGVLPASAFCHFIEFGDSYKAPLEETGKGPASESSGKKKGRTVVITTEDMQKIRNDVKERTSLLLALPDEHQLRFSKYETAKELWEAILKTFGGNEATKKTKKNQLKQQYGNFNAEGSETLEQTFNRLQAIISYLEDDLDKMSLDDVYNHLKVYEPEVQKKSESNSQNMAFISSSNTSSGKAASLSHDIICSYIASQSNGSQIKYEDITQIDSYMANEEENHALVANDEVPTKFALMTKSTSSSKNEATYLIFLSMSPMMEDMSHLDKENETLLDFKLKDDTNILLRTPRQHNMYSIDLNNIVPHKNLTCLVVKASFDERKQHKASCKTKLVNSVFKPLHTFHMDLFGPTSVSSLNHKWYCLVVTDDFSRFTWTFFLRTKDETSSILRNFISEIENLKDLKVKIIRRDNGGEFKNKEMNEFYTKKGIRREFSNDRTPQQNGVAKRRNKTLIEATRTMLAGAKPPVTFWAEAVNTLIWKQGIVIAPDGYNDDVPESSGISNPTITSKVSSGDQVEHIVSLTVESKNPTVSSHVPTVCLDISPESSSSLRLISKGDLVKKKHHLWEEPKKIFDALKDPSWVEAMQEELLQFKNQNVWILVDCPEREEGIDYEEVFAPVARIEAIRLFLAYASFIGFILYQMDVKSDFLYGTIDEEVYVMQPPRFQDPEFPDRVYKVEKAMYGLHQAPRAWYGTLSKYLLDNDFQRESDYGGATQDRKSTTGGCQFLGRRLISWQCKKQTIMATSTTEAEYVVAASGCGLVLWIQNQMLDYRDCYEKKLINVNHIHTDDNVADLLTKPFDVRRFQYLVGEGSANLTEPHHTPSPQEQHSPQNDSPPPSHPTPTTKQIPQAPTEPLTHRQYTKRAKRIAQSKALSPAADEPASLSRDDRQGEAFPTVSSLDAGQDRENIAKTFALPNESLLRVTSFDADKGSMQHRIHELMELCTSLQRQQSQMAAKIKAQDLQIFRLKARVKSLEDKTRRSAKPTQEDDLITGGIIEIGEELRANKSTKLGSNDTKEMVNVLSSMEAANILTSGGAAASVSPAEVLPAASVPTVSAIFTTASVVTPYTRRPRGITIGSSQHMMSPIIGSKDKGKQKVVESEAPKKKKLQEQIDAQVAKEMEEEFAKESQRLNEQLARDSEIARLHAEEELKMTIEGLDRSNEVIAKHLQEYENFEADLSVGEKLKLINELVKYQDHRAKILKYQAQQSKPLSKKEQREFYMAVLRSHARWKTKHFRGMTLEQIKEKCILVWKQLKDFVPMSSKEEGERVKRQGLKIDQGSSKRMKTYEDVSEEELKGMMQLIHSEGKKEYWKIIRLGGHTAVYQFFVDMLKQFDREDLHQLWTLVKETLSIRKATKDKEKELWVKLKRLFEPDFEDQLWTHNQAFMHDPLDWKLYDICGVHYVSTKD